MMFTWKTKTATQKLYWVYNKKKKLWILKYNNGRKITLAKIYWNEHSSIDLDIDYLIDMPFDSFLLYQNKYKFIGFFPNLNKAMRETIYQVQKLGYI